MGTSYFNNTLNYSCVLFILFIQTSFTSSWGIHLLSKNPSVQEKLFEEVSRVIPPGTTPSREHIDSMPYLKAVVKEVQRYILSYFELSFTLRTIVHFVLLRQIVYIIDDMLNLRILTCHNRQK